MRQMDGFEPYNQEAEEALVGAFFLEGELVKECTIRPEQLYSQETEADFIRRSVT